MNYVFNCLYCFQFWFTGFFTVKVGKVYLFSYIAWDKWRVFCCTCCMWWNSLKQGVRFELNSVDNWFLCFFICGFRFASIIILCLIRRNHGYSIACSRNHLSLALISVELWILQEILCWYNNFGFLWSLSVNLLFSLGNNCFILIMVKL